MANHIDGHHAALARQLASVRGIGPAAIATLLADVPEPGALSRHEFAVLLGLAPFNRDSGQTRGKRSAFAGRAEIRRALYMATLAAIRFNRVIRYFYDRLVAAGKPKKVAIVVRMRKLLTILNATVRSGRSWGGSIHLT